MRAVMTTRGVPTAANHFLNTMGLEGKGGVDGGGRRQRGWGSGQWQGNRADEEKGWLGKGAGAQLMMISKFTFGVQCHL